MVEPLRHRQTKGAETDMLGLTPPRHIPTLPILLKNSENERRQKTRLWLCRADIATPLHTEKLAFLPNP